MARLCLFWAAFCMVFLGGSVRADEVWLKGGGKLDGEVVETTATYVVVETAPGRVRLPLTRVLRIVKTRSPLANYRGMSGGVASNDVEGWLALARWAHANQLDTQARQAYERAATLDPSRAEAQLALGNVLYDGRWMTSEDSYRARGLVNFEGAWLSSAEVSARLAERAARREAQTREQEAAARRAEADAKARLAEAKARQAQAEAGYWPAYGGVIIPWPYQPCCGQPHAPGFCPYSTRTVIRPVPPRAMPNPQPQPPRQQPQPQPRARPQTQSGARAGVVRH